MSSYEIVTLPPALGGMNLESPPSEIDDNEAYIIQDALVNQGTYLLQRGQLKSLVGLSYTPYAIVTTTDPQGVQRVGVFAGYDDTHNKLLVLNAAMSSVAATISIDSTSLPNSQPLIQVSAAPNGVMVGWSDKYNKSTSQGIFYWGGGQSADYTNAAVTTARTSRTVTVASGFTANVTAGMWLFSGTYCIGQVMRVVDDSNLFLVNDCLKTVAAGSITFKSVRLVSATVSMVGRLTTSSASAVVNGGDTKFQKQIVGNTCDVFRYRDLYRYLGTVTSVQSDFQLTLTGNATTTDFEEQFAIIKNANTNPFTYVGWLPASYAGHMWYANYGVDVASSFDRTLNYRLWFSHPLNEEAVDGTIDGDWFEVKSSASDQQPIRGLAATHNALLVFKEDETFAVYGTTPESFEVSRIFNDGLWSPNTIQQYNNGVLWAGKRGVYYYDGSTITNLLAGKMRNIWRAGLNARDSEADVMYGAVINDHYFVNFRWNTSTLTIRGGTTTTPGIGTLAINLLTGAITLQSNLWLRGAVSVSNTTAGNKTAFIVPTSATVGGNVCNGDYLFTGSGAADDVTCLDWRGTATIGPNLVLETKKYSLGDPETIKKWKQLTLHYLTNGGTLTLQTVKGLETTGETIGTFASTSGAWAAARQRFGKLDQFLSFRIYNTSGATTTARIGPLEIKYRRMRPWRI